MVFFVNGVEVLRTEARGGPASTVNTRSLGQPMNAQPTTAGRFVIYGRVPYQTRTWALSRIRWGTPLRDSGTDILYKDGSRWQSVYQTTGATRAWVMDHYKELYGVRRVPDTWVFNDFGPMAVRYFKDMNHNGKLDKNEHLSGEMLHTTADNEAEFALSGTTSLGDSHGCVHMKPDQRDRLNSLGAFNRGVPFVVHKYSETYP